MIKRVLDEPGTEGTYDPETALAGISLTVDQMAAFYNPTQQTWRPLMAAYHEWVHYYQFHTTSFGYLHRLVWTAQMMLANGMIRVACAFRSQRRERLPLTGAALDISLREKFNGHPNELNRSMVARLQQYLDGIVGYGPHVASRDLNEWVAMMAILHEMFGTPKTVIIEPDFMPSPPFIRYPVTALLETHAHILSGTWMLQAIERENGDPEVRQEVADYLYRHMIGPYGAYMQFAGGLPPGRKGQQAKVFCALAEIALNPVGVHRHPKLPRYTTILPVYSSWFPVVRLESLMSYALDGSFRWPQDSAWPDSLSEIVDSVAAALMKNGDVPSAFLCGSGGTLALPGLEHAVDRIQSYAVDEQDVPLELLTYLLDGLGKLCVAEEIKTELPLVLDGWMIEEFKLLAAKVGGPSTLRRPGSSVPSLIGRCTGLQRLGLLDDKTLRLGSDAIVHAGAPLVRALRLLLTCSRPQLELTRSEPLFGGSGWTLDDVLEYYYGLSLTDFD